MKKLRKLSLKEELEKEAAEIEKELAEDPELDNLEVSKELDDAIYAEIQRYEKEQEEDKIKEFPLWTYKKKKRAKLLVALVAILVLVMGMSVSSVGSKSYMKELIEKFTGKSQVDVTNVKDMDSHEVNSNDEYEAYQEVDEMIHGKSVRILDRPEEMHFKSHIINDEMKQADLFYEYKGETIRYEIYLNQADSSKGVTKEDEEITTSELKVKKNKIKISERKTDKTETSVMSAEFEDKGVFYQLRGKMNKEDFYKIIKNLKFY
ncbi:MULTISPECIES: DUF4367 domain-containing protein [Clostridia]|uniref:DUF4367 domain-containing protein n=1 Tax=Clostridia TaxID=186801 RepID=UPI000E4B31B7|nr:MULTISPECIES: DUF4367 domain-containing protein [Clostridia]RGH39889.1 DUF4367 domain-containing protein [Firmicutes bacterium AM41-5BH]RKQ30345.1 DUF4367 domain-containing protein [Ruminococcus sp. B05]TAP33855.1 DUF4367 domain-containing protein [Mediterraneibacter sp. gm002]